MTRKKRPPTTKPPLALSQKMTDLVKDAESGRTPYLRGEQAEGRAREARLRKRVAARAAITRKARALSKQMKTK